MFCLNCIYYFFAQLKFNDYDAAVGALNVHGTHWTLVVSVAVSTII